MRNFVIGSALTIALLSAYTLFAQDSPAQLRPIIVNIQQSVPVMADVAVPYDGQVITATVPLTVDVSLQVSLRGETVALTAITPTTPASVALVTPAAVPAGELIVLGDAEWALLGAEDLGQTLPETGYYEQLDTDGRFVAVTFELRNLADESVYFDSVNLVDSDDRYYEMPYGAQDYVADPQLQCTIEQINPGLKKRCQVIYEVPAEATGLQIEFTDLEDRNPDTKRVGLGLD